MLVCRCQSTLKINWISLNATGDVLDSMWLEWKFYLDDRSLNRFIWIRAFIIILFFIKLIKKCRKSWITSKAQGINPEFPSSSKYAEINAKYNQTKVHLASLYVSTLANKTTTVTTLARVHSTTEINNIQNNQK